MFGGAVTTDPCSNPNSHVGATHAWTKQLNGITRPWYGSVFINPPYGRLLGYWFRKGLLEMQLGNATELIYLIPARVDTRWWHDYVMQADSICFCRGRKKFVGALASAPFPTVFIYYGPHRGRFEQAFKDEGAFWRPRDVNMSSTNEINWTELKSLADAITGMSVGTYLQVSQLTVGEIVEAVKQRDVKDGLQVVEQEHAKAETAAEAAKKVTKRKATKKPAKKKAAKKVTKRARLRAKDRLAPKKRTKKATKAKAAEAAMSQTLATAKLDDALLSNIVKACPTEDEYTTMAELRAAFSEHNDQQIRRSLVRLTNSELIVAEGNTKTRTYRPAA